MNDGDLTVKDARAVGSLSAALGILKRRRERRIETFLNILKVMLC